MKKNLANKADGSKLRIKALDIVIILLILTSVVGIYFRYNILDVLTGAKNLKDYTVSFEINDIRHTTEQYIKVGDTVYYSDGSTLGTLIEAADDSQNALIVVPTQKMFVTQNSDQVVTVSYPANTRIDASGRMLCKGAKKDDGYFLIDGTKYIAPGDRLSVKTELVTVDITITKIEEVIEQK